MTASPTSPEPARPVALTPADLARVDRMFARLPETLVAWLEAADGLAETNPALAEAAYRRILERLPNAPQPLFRLARLAGQQGDWVAANQIWAVAVARFPGHQIAVHGLAEALVQCGAPELAELALESALALPEGDGGIAGRFRTGPQVRLARLAAANGNLARAREVAAALAAAAPGDGAVRALCAELAASE